MNSKRVLGNGLLLLTAFIWGTAFVAQRTGMESIEPITFNAARMALSAILIGGLALVMRAKRRKSQDERHKEGTIPDVISESGPEMISDSTPKARSNAISESKLENAPDAMSEARTKIGSDVIKETKAEDRNTVLGGVLCGLFLSVASIFQQMGLVYTTAGKAGFITAMYMLLVPILGFVLFKKKNTWLVWLAVLLGIAGMYLLCVTGEFTLAHGDALVLVCAVMFSGHILSCDRFVRLGRPLEIAALQFVTAAVVSWVAAFIAEEPTLGKLASAAVPIIYCGVMSGAIGYTLQIVAQKYTDPTIASLLMSMESVFAVLAGAVLLNERMTAREIVGCVVMFVAIVLVQIPRKTSTS
ncbi:MAG: DMT family transporter [Lachnospiraceae bacterium]|nr:DMT family transporter [Lachnospiraceae bacterium]